MDTNATAVKSKRKTYIDFLRIVAIYMVLFNHSGKNGMMLFTISRQSPFYPFYLFNSIFIKIAVPVFLMISGTLLLGKNESYSDIVKRFLKFAAVLLAASFISYLYDCFYRHSMTFSIIDFFIRVYKQPISIALWYMYSYLAFILMLPFMRTLAQNMDKNAFRWMLVMHGLISLLPIIEYILRQGNIHHYSGFSFFISPQFVLYPLLGYYFGYRIKEEELSAKTMFGLIIAGISAIVLCSVMTHWKCTLTGQWDSSKCQTFFNTLIFLPSCATFYTARYIFSRYTISPRICRTISTIGGATFGLFLLERICRFTTEPIRVALRPYMPTIFACWIWIFAACTLGIVITLILKKIPFIANVL